MEHPPAQEALSNQVVGLDALMLLQNEHGDFWTRNQQTPSDTSDEEAIEESSPQRRRHAPSPLSIQSLNQSFEQRKVAPVDKSKRFLFSESILEPGGSHQMMDNISELKLFLHSCKNNIN